MNGDLIETSTLRCQYCRCPLAEDRRMPICVPCWAQHYRHEAESVYWGTRRQRIRGRFELKERAPS